MLIISVMIGDGICCQDNFTFSPHKLKEQYNLRILSQRLFLQKIYQPLEILTTCEMHIRQIQQYQMSQRALDDERRNNERRDQL